MPEPTFVADLAMVAEGSPHLLRGAVGLVGAILLLAGARVYKLALALAGFGVGAVLVAAGLVWGSGYVPALAEPTLVAVASVIGGLLLMAVISVVHRLGLVGVGALVGASAAGGVADAVSGAPPFWVPFVGALAGAIALPFLFPTLLKVATPAVGAVLIGWAVGMPTHPWLLLGLWIFGMLVQLRSPRREREAEA